MVKGLGVRVLGLKFPWIRVQRFWDVPQFPGLCRIHGLSGLGLEL